MNTSTTAQRAVHPRCKGVAQKLAILFRDFYGSVPFNRLIEAGLSHPNVEAAITQGLLIRDGEQFRLTEYASHIR